MGITSGLANGYCELTEDEELFSIVKELLCPFCGRLHRSKLHDELNKLYTDDEAYNAAYSKAMGAGEDPLSSFMIAKHHPGFPMELFDNEQEYTPEE